MTLPNSYTASVGIALSQPLLRGFGTEVNEANIFLARRDYRVVQGCTLVIALSYVTVNLLVDLAYGLADPRIRTS